jgi:hypothetical protein
MRQTCRLVTPCSDVSGRPTTPFGGIAGLSVACIEVRPATDIVRSVARN